LDFLSVDPFSPISLTVSRNLTSSLMSPPFFFGTGGLGSPLATVEPTAAKTERQTLQIGSKQLQRTPSFDAVSNPWWSGDVDLVVVPSETTSQARLPGKVP
jgi:hypothetical protein